MIIAESLREMYSGVRTDDLELAEQLAANDGAGANRTQKSGSRVRSHCRIRSLPPARLVAEDGHDTRLSAKHRLTQIPSSEQTSETLGRNLDIPIHEYALKLDHGHLEQKLVALSDHQPRADPPQNGTLFSDMQETHMRLALLCMEGGIDGSPAHRAGAMAGCAFRDRVEVRRVSETVPDEMVQRGFIV